MFQTLRIRCFVSVPCVGTVSPWWKVASRGRNVGGRFAGSGGAAGSTGGFLESWSERVWPGQGDGHMPPDVLRCLGRCGCWFGTGGECVCEGQGREKEGPRARRSAREGQAGFRGQQSPPAICPSWFARKTAAARNGDAGKLSRVWMGIAVQSR